MIATTTINSIKVKPRDVDLFMLLCPQKKAARRRLLRDQPKLLSRSLRASWGVVLGIGSADARPGTVDSAAPGNRAARNGLSSRVAQSADNRRCSGCSAQRDLRIAIHLGGSGGRATLSATRQHGRGGRARIAIRFGANGCLTVEQASVDLRLQRSDFSNRASDLGLSNVGLVLRNRDSSQDTNDRHNDHQFNKGETLLHIACDGTTVHSLTPGWLVVTPGNLPGARELPQHLCHPPNQPSVDRTRHLCLPTCNTMRHILCLDASCMTNMSTGKVCQCIRKSTPHPPSTTGYPGAPSPPPDALPAPRSGS